MEKIADDLSEESELALEDRVSRVEPALVLVCSILVGLILLSVMLPLMHIMSAIVLGACCCRRCAWRCCCFSPLP